MDVGTGSVPNPSSPAIDSNVHPPAPDPPVGNAGASLGEAASPEAGGEKKRKPRAPRAANTKSKVTSTTVAEPSSVVVDAHFFAGMSSTLKQLKRRDRELRLSSLQIV